MTASNGCQADEWHPNASRTAHRRIALRGSSAASSRATSRAAIPSPEGNRTSHALDARPANPAIAARVLRQILLVVGLGVVERRRVGDLRGDRAIALFGKRAFVHHARG